MSEQVDTSELYRAPKADLTKEPEGGYDETRAISPKGRFGRIQYLAYSMGISLPFMLAFGLLGAVSAAMGENAKIVIDVGTIVLYAIFLPFSFIFVIRRLHDFNWSGWASLLIIIPIVNAIFGLALLFVPGTKGANKFGQPPRPAGRLAGVAVTLFILSAVIGVLAAIAIPAYQDYAKAAQATKAQHQVEAPQPAN